MDVRAIVRVRSMTDFIPAFGLLCPSDASSLKTQCKSFSGLKYRCYLCGALSGA